MVYIPECSTVYYSVLQVIALCLNPFFCYSRSNKCSSWFSAMSCCRLVGFTVGIRDSWSFSISSLRKRDLQEVKRKDILINNCTTLVISLIFRVHNKQNSLLDLWREVLFIVAAVVCCFDLLYLTPGVTADTLLLESWQWRLNQLRLQWRLIKNSQWPQLNHFKLL